MKNILLAIILLFCCLTGGLAQDTTCNIGDIAYVVETVNADVGTANAGAACLATTAGAEYNNPAAPFGIQGVFDCACPGLQVRIIAGANDYDSTTASWTNRDADKTIDIDQIAGTVANPILVQGYTDATTLGLASLNFEKAAIAGNQGFLIGQVRYLWQLIRLYDADSHCWETTQAQQIFYQTQAAGCTNTGYNPNTGGQPNTFIENIAENNGTWGFFFDNSVVIGYRNISRGNQRGYRIGSTAAGAMFDNIAYNNTLEGFEVYSALHILVNNLAIGNAGDGMLHGNGAANASQTVIMNNIFTGNGGDGLKDIVATGSIGLLANNNYSNNVGIDKNVTAFVVLDLDTTPDTSNPTITPPDFTPTSVAMNYIFTFPDGVTLSNETKGAAQVSGGSAGSNDVAY